MKKLMTLASMALFCVALGAQCPQQKCGKKQTEQTECCRDKKPKKKGCCKKSGKDCHKKHSKDCHKKRSQDCCKK